MASSRREATVRTDTVAGNPLAWMKAIEFPEWMGNAVCSPNDAVWFPATGGGRGHHERMAKLAAEAKAICAGCPVRDECLTYAFETDQRHGVWGGLDPYERRQLRTRGRRTA